MSHAHLVVSVASDLFDTSIHFFSFLIISLLFLLFLLLDIFNFHDVVDKYRALPLVTLAPWPRTSLPQVMSHDPKARRVFIKGMEIQIPTGELPQSKMSDKVQSTSGKALNPEEGGKICPTMWRELGMVVT